MDALFELLNNYDDEYIYELYTDLRIKGEILTASKIRAVFLKDRLYNKPETDFAGVWKTLLSEETADLENDFDTLNIRKETGNEGIVTRINSLLNVFLDRKNIRYVNDSVLDYLYRLECGFLNRDMFEQVMGLYMHNIYDKGFDPKTLLSILEYLEVKHPDNFNSVVQKFEERFQRISLIEEKVERLFEQVKESPTIQSEEYDYLRNQLYGIIFYNYHFDNYDIAMYYLLKVLSVTPESNSMYDLIYFFLKHCVEPKVNIPNTNTNDCLS